MEEKKGVGEHHVVYDVDKWSVIDFEKLPDQFVMKGTHDSGGAFVCRNKNNFNFEVELS